MKSIIHLCAVIVIFPECIDYNLALKIPGLPISLGVIAFMVIGIFELFSKKFLFNKRIILVVGAIHILSVLASFFQDDIVQNTSRSVASLLLFLASCGLSIVLLKNYNSKFFLVYFTVLFIYWGGYIFENVLVGNEVKNYQLIEGIVNHHVSGFGVGVSAIYLVNFFGFRGVNIIPSSLLILISTYLLVLSESRSGLLFFIATLTILYFLTHPISFKYVIAFSILGLTISFIAYNYVFSDVIVNDRIRTRFDITNEEYIKQTNLSRLELYNEFFPTLLKYPEGLGTLNPKVETSFGPKLMHNKYATFVISGGIFSFFLVMIMIREIILFFLRFRRRYLYEDIHFKEKGILSLIAVLIFFYLVLLTLEIGGLLYHSLFSITLMLIIREDILNICLLSGEDQEPGN